MAILTKQDYDHFVEMFGEDIRKVQPDTCFYLYGSYIRGRADFGRSDLDGGIILNDDVVTDEKKIRELSSFIGICMAETRIPIQFNLMDRETNRDGRFMSYTRGYIDSIKQTAKIVAGPDYVQEMNGLDFKSGALYASSFNLRELRNNLFKSHVIKFEDPDEYSSNFQKSLERASTFPKKMIYLAQDKLVEKKEEALNELQGMFPSLDLSILHEITGLLKSPDRIYSISNDFQCSFNLSLKALNQSERLIKEYMKKFPNISEREAKI
jgi:hypothetical protein